MGIEGLEDKIWRKLEITDRRTVAYLAYTILATFDSLAYHLYNIKHDKDKYDCIIAPLDLGDSVFRDAVKTKLSEVYLYPNVANGASRGILDDMTCYELKDIVEDIDKKGYSEYYVTPGYQKHGKFDYRKFNVKTNNKKLKGLILEIKNGFEVGE